MLVDPDAHRLLVAVLVSAQSLGVFVMINRQRPSCLTDEPIVVVSHRLRRPFAARLHDQFDAEPASPNASAPAVGWSRARWVTELSLCASRVGW